MDKIITNLHDDIPIESKEIFGYLLGQMIKLTDAWKLFYSLFHASPEITTLINQSGHDIFCVIYDCIENDLILSICKLTESTQSKGRNRHKHKNFVFRQLSKTLEPKKYQGLIDKLKKHHKVIDDNVDDLKLWRDKYIAHLDYHILLQGTHISLPSVSPEKYKQALLAMEDYLNEFYSYFIPGDKYTLMLGGFPSYDFNKFLSRLKKAIAYDILEKEGKIQRNFWTKIDLGSIDTKE